MIHRCIIPFRNRPHLKNIRNYNKFVHAMLFQYQKQLFLDVPPDIIAW